uniref:D-lactate dehydrogenase (cytochrome) n=1 Tax=Phallusia mammillata TaxID=59560 RepID=A0A6F9DK51_9ASCI|nr:probable D-lactate dehydrogenase, mitochondrial [Phallusia mammillata]
MPECILSAVCSFPTVLDAVNTASQVLQSGVPIARIELLDEVTMDAVNKFSKLNKPVAPTLFLEFHGSENGAKEQVNVTSEIAVENKGSDFEWAETQEQQNHLWKARHDVLYALLALRPGTRAVSTDVCVPISALPQAVTYAQSAVKESGLVAGILGHVGDGNFHCTLGIDIESQEELSKVKKLSGDIAQFALQLDGTCTGEHGIGIGKCYLLQEEVGSAGIGVMKSIKASLDPQNLMNPGKVFECMP